MFQSYLIFGTSSQKLRAESEKIAKDAGLTLSANSPDIFLISPVKKSITIEQIRNLKSHIAQKPLKEKYKLIIIENADMLTTEAQNALLKTLEEPPSHALIILEAKNYKSLISTILSRVVKVKVSLKKTAIGDRFPRSKDRGSLILAQNSQMSRDIQSHAILKDLKSRSFFAQNKSILETHTAQALLEISQVENPQEFLDNQIVSLTKSLSDAIRAQKSTTAQIRAIEKCLETKKMIDANVNPKFALANLIFSLNLS